MRSHVRRPSEQNCPEVCAAPAAFTPSNGDSASGRGTHTHTHTHAELRLDLNFRAVTTVVGILARHGVSRVASTAEYAVEPHRTLGSTLRDGTFAEVHVVHRCCVWSGHLGGLLRPKFDARLEGRSAVNT